MARHEHVYGICENKCLVEVLPKSEAFSKSEFIIIEATNEISHMGDDVFRHTFQSIGLKNGDKVIAISAMQKFSSETIWYNKVYPSSNNDKSYPEIRINDSSNDVFVRVGNTKDGAQSIDYRVVLMKL